MIVVDAAPLIYLSRINRIDLLRRLYARIILPQGVWDEVVTEAHGRPGGSELENGVKEGWIRTQKVAVTKSLEAEGAVGADLEVITLAKKTKLAILTNDKSLALIAKTHGIEVKWLTQAVIEAARKKIITNPDARMLLRDMVRAGLRIRSEVLTEVIHQIE